MASRTASMMNGKSSQTAPTMNGKKDRLRVVIVGGSITGLTLAHALYHSDVDFVLLEARGEIAPQVGASIVILPNGSRILDQLGVFDHIYSMVEPLTMGLTWTKDGKNLLKDDSPVFVGVRMGYPPAFLQRKDLLQGLFEQLPDTSKVHTSKRVCKVDHSTTGVVVHCEDGSSYSGDIVVGSDGVHSAIKPIMLQHIELSKPGTTKKDNNSVSAEFNCIFGLGNPVEGVVRPGDAHRSYSEGHSTISFVGRGGMLYWFLFTRMDKRYYGKDIPKFSKAEMEEAAKAFYKIHMTDSITFEQVWEKRTFANMCCVEEATNDHWTSGRFVCLGDSMHKMTPNMGAGGNAAIESAAALANSLSKLRSANPSLAQVEAALNEFYQKRHPRANSVIKAANDMTRLEALTTLHKKIMALHVIPNLGSDFLADLLCDAMVGAELIESLPPPPRSLEGTMPYNPELGVGKHESKLVRALYALPLLLVLYGASRTMGVTVDTVVPVLAKGCQAGELALGDGQVVPVLSRYFGNKGIDDFFAIYVGFFTPSIGGLDVAGRMQALAFLGDLIPIQAIWMIEGIRRGNVGTAANLLPTLFGVIYQLRGIGYIAPIYYFLHYVQSPIEKYQAADNRLTQMGPVKTIIPTIVLTYILPSIAMFTAPRLTTRQWVNGVFWQPFPVYAAILQRVFGLFVKDTTKEDRSDNPLADMPYLRRTYIFAGVAAALANLYVRFRSPVSLTDVFFQGVRNPIAAVPLALGVAKFLRYDQIASFGAGAIWTALSFHDLKKARKVTAGWGKIVGVFTGTTIVAGPGAAMAAMWAWREEALTKRVIVTPKK